MAANEVHVEDRGTSLRVTVKDGNRVVNLTNHSVKFLFTKPPNHETLMEKSGTITDATNGIVEYVFESGFVDKVGTWEYQLQVTSGTSQWKSDITKLNVFRNVI